VEFASRVELPGDAERHSVEPHQTDVAAAFLDLAMGVAQGVEAARVKVREVATINRASIRRHDCLGDGACVSVIELTDQDNPTRFDVHPNLEDVR
jgi:hypothetical protein